MQLKLDRPDPSRVEQSRYRVVASGIALACFARNPVEPSGFQVAFGLVMNVENRSKSEAKSVYFKPPVRGARKSAFVANEPKAQLGLTEIWAVFSVREILHSQLL